MGHPRVLPLGRILRKTKLNEVPQLINILTGDMSIEGMSINSFILNSIERELQATH
jgi:hypothetical protein